MYLHEFYHVDQMQWQDIPMTTAIEVASCVEEDPCEPFKVGDDYESSGYDTQPASISIKWLKSLLRGYHWP